VIPTYKEHSGAQLTLVGNRRVWTGFERQSKNTVTKNANTPAV